MQNSSLHQLQQALQPWVGAVSQHRVLQSIDSLEKLRRFAQIHVFAVWDFMCLLKGLQRRLVCMQPLWLPPTDHLGCHLVSTLLTEEESDQMGEDRYLSHFELYVQAMQQCGADAKGINQFMADIRDGMSLSLLLTQGYVPLPARQFVADTFAVIEQPSHCIAASFAFAREHITSAMFSAILAPLAQTQAIDKFLHYFQRHIELDGEMHSVQSQRLVTNLCGNDAHKWQEATAAAIFSLQSRLRLLDGIAAELGESTHPAWVAGERP